MSEHCDSPALDHPPADVDRIASKLAGSLAHDLRNPLGVISNALYLLRLRAEGDERTLRQLDGMDRAVRQLTATLDRVLAFGRLGSITPALIPAAELVRAAANDAILPEKIAVEPAVEPTLMFRGDAASLSAALVAMFSNSVRAMEGEGTIEVAAEREKGGVRLAVRDRGTGFTAEALQRGFEPLYSSRRQGAGLGLYLVARVAQAHGGQARAANRPGGGAEVSLWLPDSTP
jgi:signal transduction histidine kinase